MAPATEPLQCDGSTTKPRLRIWESEPHWGAAHELPADVATARAIPEQAPPVSLSASAGLFSADQVAALLAAMQSAAGAMVRPLPPAAVAADNGASVQAHQLTATQLVARDVAESFFGWLVANRSKKTVTLYRASWESLSSSLSGPSAKWSEVTISAVYRWVQSHGGDWGPTSQHNAIRDIKRLCSWLLKSRLIDSNPLTGIESPRVAVRRTYVSPEIHRRVMDSLAEDGFRSLIELAWETGARPQELRLIEPRHCDLVRGRIVFQASEAKGKKRDRVIWLSETAALIVSMLIASRTGDGPLLRTNDGTAWSAWAISNRFRRLKRVLGLPSLCLYEYRHGFAVRKLDDSIESLTVAQLMGHVDTKMLSRVYGHLDQNERLMKAALGHAKEARHDVEISSPP